MIDSRKENETSEYVKKHFRKQLKKIPLNKRLFLDETGSYLNMSLAYGRSKKGKPVYERKLTRTNQKLNTIAVISHKGLKVCRHYKRALNTQQFIYFLDYFVLPVLKNETLIMDRHPVHCAKEVKEFMIKNKIRFLYLPPYSPDLNPIENVFSKVKLVIKTHQPKTIDRLKYIMKLAFQSVSEKDYRAYFRHAFSCLFY